MAGIITHVTGYYLWLHHTYISFLSPENQGLIKFKKNLLGTFYSLGFSFLGFSEFLYNKI